jgi:two-component system chemotaxis response regulator CheY
MVVDDDEHVRTFLVVLLRKVVSGPFLEARDGAEAIEMYYREKPDLVFLDVNMPIMDGLEALAKFREDGIDVPIIMITSLATRRIVDEALQTGASNFVRKDTSKADMIKIIKSTIEHCLPDHRESGE